MMNCFSPKRFFGKGNLELTQMLLAFVNQNYIFLFYFLQLLDINSELTKGLIPNPSLLQVISQLDRFTLNLFDIKQNIG